MVSVVAGRDPARSGGRSMPLVARAPARVNHLPPGTAVHRRSRRYVVVLDSFSGARARGTCIGARRARAVARQRRSLPLGVGVGDGVGSPFHTRSAVSPTSTPTTLCLSFSTSQVSPVWCIGTGTGLKAAGESVLGVAAAPRRLPRGGCHGCHCLPRLLLPMPRLLLLPRLLLPRLLPRLHRKRHGDRGDWDRELDEQSS